MPWYFYLAYFFAGAFAVNAVPHFVSGVCGRPFPTPFAKPPGKGLSSPVVNVLWAAFNASLAFALLRYVGEFHFRLLPDALAFATGALLLAVMTAKIFGTRLAGK
ncbi:MAG TPA: hypothetical protein VGD60_00790 [Candidatus Acidoferrales bacterium]